MAHERAAALRAQSRQAAREKAMALRNLRRQQQQQQTSSSPPTVVFTSTPQGTPSEYTVPLPKSSPDEPEYVYGNNNNLGRGSSSASEYMLAGNASISQEKEPAVDDWRDYEKRFEERTVETKSPVTALQRRRTRRSKTLLKKTTGYPSAVGIVQYVFVQLPGPILMFLLFLGGPAGLGYYYWQDDAVKLELSLDAFRAPEHVVSRESVVAMT